MAKNLPASAGDVRGTGSTPESERSAGEGNGNPLKYSCLENPMDRGTWWASPSMGFPGGSDGKEPACSVGDSGLIPGSGRSLGEGNGNPLQYPCLENSMDGGAWCIVVEL